MRLDRGSQSGITNLTRPGLLIAPLLLLIGRSVAECSDSTGFKLNWTFVENLRWTPLGGDTNRLVAHSHGLMKVYGIPGKSIRVITSARSAVCVLDGESNICFQADACEGCDRMLNLKTDDGPVSFYRLPDEEEKPQPPAT